MDTVTLVEGQIDDGQRLLDMLDEEGFVVRAAFWVKPVDEDRWSLYIVAPVVDEHGALSAYRQVLQVLRPLGNVWLIDSDIKLIGEKHPFARQVLDLQKRFPGRMVTRSRRDLLGGMPVEEVYVYPPGKVEVTIYGMIFRGEPGGTLHLSLERHNQDSYLTVGSGGQRHVYPAETGIDWVVAAPEGAMLEEDETGRRVLVWDLHGNRMKSSANEVWSFAKLGLHGFRFLRKPA